MKNKITKSPLDFLRAQLYTLKGACVLRSQTPEATNNHSLFKSQG